MTPIAGGVLLLLQVAANAELGYRFPVPEGFVAFPEGRRQQNMVECWTEPVAPSARGALVLCVQRLRGTLPRERLQAGDLPPSSRLQAFRWRGFDIDGIRTDTVAGGDLIVAFAAQVPLRGEAVQLILAGPRDQSQRAEAIMTATLAGFEGETNWLTSEERAGRIGNIVGWALGIGIGVVLIRIVVARRRAAA